jgi:hypothetical protein
MQKQLLIPESARFDDHTVLLTYLRMWFHSQGL